MLLNIATAVIIGLVLFVLAGLAFGWIEIDDT